MGALSSILGEKKEWVVVQFHLPTVHQGEVDFKLGFFVLTI